jgi:carbon-monoxide dehydrogenase small subunit
MIVAAHALIERKGGEVSREEVIEALGGHYCRCTGYAKILEAVVAASRGEVDVTAEPEVETGAAA